MRILVTGSKGMIGSHLVKGLLDAGYEVVGLDKSGDSFCDGKYHQEIVDLADRDKLADIFQKYHPDRVVHLAALAHTVDGKDFSWEDYRHLNVDCAKNVFDAAGDIPVLFISTVDVFGFTTGTVSAKTPLHPVSDYGRSKMQAEQEVRKKKSFDIFRFSPVYTDTVKRDIQKRYYLKYPNIAYQIGKGTEYEILNVTGAVQAMVGWCGREPANTVRIIKDAQPMWTPDYIAAEKAAGRAKVVLRIPAWMVNCGYAVLKGIWGENRYTYLLNKAVHPLRSE